MKYSFMFLFICNFCSFGATTSLVKGATTHVGIVSAGGGSSPVPELLWYKFSEGIGTTVTDYSIGANTGTLGTGATWVTGENGSGSAISNDGAHTAVVSGSNVTFATNKISICCWVKIVTYPSAGKGEVVCGGPTGLPGTPFGHIYVDLNGNLYGEIAGGFTQCYRYVSPATGSWHHYAALLDNSSSTGIVTIYVDGVNQTGSAFSDATGTSNYGVHKVGISGTDTGGNVGTGGNILVDDVRIYNRLITSSEVTSIYGDPQ